MTLDELGARLIRSHNYEERPGLLLEIRRSLEGFSDENLQRIWDKYIENWQSDKSPRPAHFIAWSREVQAARRTNEVPYRKCECGAVYSMQGSACPACGSNETKTILLGSQETSHIPMRHDCHICDNFMTEDAHGPHCDDWSFMNLEWKPCSTCVCFHCCSVEVLHRHLSAQGEKLPVEYMGKKPHEYRYKEEISARDIGRQEYGRDDILPVPDKGGSHTDQR